MWIPQGENYSCSCIDCPVACPAPPTFPEPLHVPFEINGINGYFIVVGAAFVVYLLILAVVFLWSRIKAKRGFTCTCKFFHVSFDA